MSHEDTTYEVEGWRDTSSEEEKERERERERGRKRWRHERQLKFLRRFQLDFDPLPQSEAEASGSSFLLLLLFCQKKWQKRFWKKCEKQDSELKNVFVGQIFNWKNKPTRVRTMLLLSKSSHLDKDLESVNFCPKIAVVSKQKLEQEQLLLGVLLAGPCHKLFTLRTLEVREYLNV